MIFLEVVRILGPNIKEQVFAVDGCHLTDMGHKKLYRNLRAEVVAYKIRLFLFGSPRVTLKTTRLVYQLDCFWLQKKKKKTL